MKQVFAILPILALTIFSIEGLHSPNAQRVNREALYLPNINATKILSFGYAKPLSHLLWFKTLNYFGKHYASDKNYRYLKHQCALIHELNPDFLDGAEFCALMLAWELKQPEAAIEILDKAIQAPNILRNNEAWRLYYLRGIDKAYFLKNNIEAAADFFSGAKLPNAPAFMLELAQKTAKNTELDMEDFFINAIQNAKDKRKREVLIKQLKAHTQKEKNNERIRY